MPVDKDVSVLLKKAQWIPAADLALGDFMHAGDRMITVGRILPQGDQVQVISDKGTCRLYDPDELVSVVYRATPSVPRNKGRVAAANPFENPKFQAWFAGSKVVDAEGLPLRCYHGTKSSIDFDEFSVDGPPWLDDEEQASSSGSGPDPTAYLGAHFAQEPQTANQFANGSGWMHTRNDGPEEKPRVIPVFLSIKNPKDFGSEHNLLRFICEGKISGHAEDVLLEAMGAEGLDPYDDESDAVQAWWQEYEEDVQSRAEINEYVVKHLRSDDDSLNDAARELAYSARGRLEQQGYDGIRYKNEIEGGISWIAFWPGQVKSAFAQNFDPKDQRFVASVKTAAWTVGGRRGELGMRQDNPLLKGYEGAEEWIKSHPKTTTAWYDLVDIPTAEVVKLPGARNEHLSPDPARVDELAASMGEKGYLKGHQVFICVEQNGQPFIYEGNHRARAAFKAGMATVPCEVRYFGGSEEIPGVWDPANDPEVHKTASIESNESLTNLLKPQAGGWTGEEKETKLTGDVSVFIDPNGSYRFVKFIDGKPVAAAQLLSQNKKTAYVSNMYVIPEYRRCGYGSELMKFARKIFKGGLTFSTDCSNQGAAFVQSQTKTAGKHSYSCIMGDVPEDSNVATLVDRFRAEIDDADLMGDGKDIGQNHVTLRYGMIGNDPAIKEYLSTLSPIEVSCGATIAFDPTTHSDGAAPIVMPCSLAVLKPIYEHLGTIGEWKPADFEYTPHITIAYVKPEAAEKYVGKRVRSAQNFTIRRVEINDADDHSEWVELTGTAKTADGDPFAKWLGVDLDGTLAEALEDYSDPTVIGAPIATMVERVKKALAEGIPVKVFTARMYDKENAEAIQKAIGDWTEEHIGTRLEATNEKTPGCIEIWDDRARRVDEGTGKFAGQYDGENPDGPAGFFEAPENSHSERTVAASLEKEAGWKGTLLSLATTLLSGALTTAAAYRTPAPEAGPRDKALNQIGHQMIEHLPDPILSKIGNPSTITFREGVPSDGGQDAICQVAEGTRIVYVNPKYVDTFLHTDTSDQLTAHEVTHIMQSEIDPNDNRFPKVNTADPYGAMKDPGTIVGTLVKLRAKGDRMWDHSREEQAAIVQQYEALVDMRPKATDDRQKKEIEHGIKVLGEYVADYNQLKVGSHTARFLAPRDNPITASFDKTALNVPKLVADFGAKLETRFIADHEGVPQDRVHVLKEQFPPEKIISLLSEADPTPNKEYTAWLTRCYAKDSLCAIQDIAQLKPLVERFDQLKRSGTLPVEDRDINKLPGAKELGELNHKYDGIDTTSKNKKNVNHEARLIRSGAADVFFNDAKYKIIIPHTEEAAKYFGINTKWCTAANENNAFAQYNANGPLYIILVKAENLRFQFQFPDHQFKDEKDNNIRPYPFFKKYPELAKLFEPLIDATIAQGSTDLNYCEDCLGSGSQICSRCDGTGDIECYECNGSGREGKCGNCRDGEKECPTCEGCGVVDKDDDEDGQETCLTCTGDGTVECEECGGDGRKECEECGGSGKTWCNSCDEGSRECETCDGSGFDPAITDFQHGLQHALHDIYLGSLLKTAAPRSTWYHGSSIKNLRSILKQGLVPEVKEKNWKDDPHAGMLMPSRESYGGIYVTRNLMTATSAPLDRLDTGIVVVVAMELQPNTFFLDEDRILANLPNPLGHMSDSSYHILRSYIAATHPEASEDYNEMNEGLKEKYVEGFLKRVRYEFEERNMTMHPDLEKRLRELVPQVWLPALARSAAHASRNCSPYDLSSAFRSVYGSKARNMDTPPPADLYPTVEQGETAFRNAAEQVTRTCKLLGRITEDDSKDGALTSANARVTDPIGYSGSNRITAVIEIRGGRQWRNGGWKDPAPMIVHRGQPPADFFEQYKQRQGDNFVVTRAKSEPFTAALLRK